LSYSKRVEWFEKNLSMITNLQTYFILSAENKFMFLACCFEIKRFVKFLDNIHFSEFESFLPIQLDGTCNFNTLVYYLKRLIYLNN